MFDEDSGEPDHEEIDFEFEMSGSEDMLTVTLTCCSNRPLAPDEFAQALRDYAASLEIFEHMSTETRH